jgi:hypothetical protein
MILLDTEKKELYLNSPSYENTVDDRSHKTKKYSLDNVEQCSVIRHFRVIVQFPVSGVLRCSDQWNNVHVALINYHGRRAASRVVQNEPFLTNNIKHQDVVFDFLPLPRRERQQPCAEALKAASMNSI